MNNVAGVTYLLAHWNSDGDTVRQKKMFPKTDSVKGDKEKLQVMFVIFTALLPSRGKQMLWVHSPRTYSNQQNHLQGVNTADSEPPFIYPSLMNTTIACYIHCVTMQMGGVLSVCVCVCS